MIKKTIWGRALSICIFASLVLFYNNCAKTGNQSEVDATTSNSFSIDPNQLVKHNSDFAVIDLDGNIINTKNDLSGIQEKIYWNGTGNATTAPRWKNGIVNWYYNPSGQPTVFSQDEALAIIKNSIASWQTVCGIRWVYQGITTRSTNATSDTFVTIGWGEANGYNGGFTTVLWNGSLNFIDSDLEMSSSGIRDAQSLQGIMNHELGHQLGLDHSDVSESIMFANPYHTAPYMLSLRSDDIQGCVGLYGQAGIVSPTPTPIPAPTATPTSTPIPTPKPSVTPAPTATPKPSVTPSPTPKPKKSSSPRKRWTKF